MGAYVSPGYPVWHGILICVPGGRGALWPVRIMKWFIKIVLSALLVVVPSGLRAEDGTAAPVAGTNSLAEIVHHREDVRMTCIENRRMICGRILRVLPDGLLVDSGYADLMRPPLNSSWLVPGTVQASRSSSLVEGREPEAICVGPIFLVDLPKSHGPGPKPKQYDYVILLGYPSGEHTYHSVGNVTKTVRQFSGTLQRAVDRNLMAEAAAKK